jgi:UDP-N-acetylglucosamine transferase subunit ALG13
MIFVTVGTHEQQFNRLIEKMDYLADQDMNEDIIIQTGYSTYEPKYCRWSKMFQYQEIQNYIQNARVIITHGGPSSFMMALQIGKIPIVVPRQKQYGEHMNDHQVDFVKAVEARFGNIIVVEDIECLAEVLAQYNIDEARKAQFPMHNIEFNIAFEHLVHTAMGDG